MRKSWLSLGAPLLLALVFAACGDDPGPTSIPAASQSSGSEATATTGAGATAGGSSSAATGDTTKAAPPKLGTYSGAATTAKAPDFEALPGAKAVFGKLGNTVYRIEMPEKWNGELVLWAHGFRGFDNSLSVESPPQALRSTVIAQGYAWAASSYSENGYTPGIGADDTLALKRYFEQQYGKPKRTYLAGFSMGGNVITLSLENFAGEYDGALAMCGALTGEEEIDYLTSWSMVGEYTSGVKIPIGQGATAVTQTLLGSTAAALGPPESPTARGKQFASVIKNLTGGDRPFFKEGFVDQYMVNFGLLIADPNRTSLPGRASTNVGVTYHVDPGLGLDDAALNAGVRRLEADPGARDRKAHPDAVPTTGKITKPLLTLHGTGDLFVPISLEQSYQKKATAAGSGELLVQRAIRSAGHCRFSEDEEKAAWNDLVNWVATGKKPGGDDLSGDLRDIGKQFTTPLRPGDPGNK